MLLIVAALGGLAYLLFKGTQTITNIGQKTTAAVTAGAQDTANQIMYGAAFNPTDVVPGTGQTVAELTAIGYTGDQIGQMYQQDSQDWLANNGAVDMTIPTF
jgi:hypothetical protein